MRGYDLRALARREGRHTCAANLASGQNRGKSFDQLWNDDAAWVRVDLCGLAGLVFYEHKEKVKARLLAMCREHKIRKVTVPEVSP